MGTGFTFRSGAEVEKRGVNTGIGAFTIVLEMCEPIDFPVRSSTLMASKTLG